MKIKQIAIAAAVSAALVSPLAMADNARADRSLLRHSFSADVTRTSASGSIMSRHTAQVATDNGFRRESTMTGPEGNTASRTVEGSHDLEAGINIRTVQGTRMNGDTYSGERILQKTEDGYERVTSRTNAAGETATRQVNAVVDEANHTITKNISATGFNGEVHNTTVVKAYGTGDAE